ncbi:hypothetical protein B7494_g3497 [Chlorociboria aeruginascens]|nr:hypothetical protein B7494_g3497 [Chlorociboria aeruginascens]
MSASMDDNSDARQNVVEADDQDDGNGEMDRSFTLRALLAGLFLGVLINLSNIISIMDFELVLAVKCPWFLDFWDLLDCSQSTPQSPWSTTPPDRSSASRLLVGARRDQYFGASAEEPLLPCGNDFEWKLGMNCLSKGATMSGLITVFIYFVPIFHSLLLLGLQAANKWFWTLDISPGFFGQGIITGPIIPLHMLIGALVGWGVLSPYAKHRGWAPGKVDDWEIGLGGWSIWVSLAALLADASVKLAWFLIRPFSRQYLASGYLQKRLIAVFENIDRNPETQPHRGEYIAVPFEIQDESETAQHHITRGSGYSPSIQSEPYNEAYRSPQSPLSSRVLALGLLGSVIVCTLVIHLIFGNIILWHYTILAIAISLPMAIVGIRSLAETDYNPESALGMFSEKLLETPLILASIVSQLVSAPPISHSNPNGIIVNLISAAVAQAGADQAGELSYDFKVGSLVGARSEAQVYGQIIGSLFGALISCGIYKLYALSILYPEFSLESQHHLMSLARQDW